MSDVSREEFDHLREKLATQQQQIDELEQRDKRKSEQITTLKEENAELKERVDDLESSHDLTQNTVWELEDTVTGEFDFSHPNVAGQNSVIDRLDDLEDCLAGGNHQGDASENTLVDTISDDWVPIERNALMDHDELKEHCGPSDRRATMLFKHWNEWSTTTPKGKLMKTADSLRTLLSTACDEHLKWKQVYRACRRVEQLSKGTITFFQHDTHGWMLKQHSAFASHQTTDAGMTASSVA